MKIDASDAFKCSKHGAMGNPECAECWEKLRALAGANNAYVSMDDKTKKKAMR